MNHFDDDGGPACFCQTQEEIDNCDWVCSGDLTSCTPCGAPVSNRIHAGFRCDDCLATVGDALGEIIPLPEATP